MGFFAFQSFKYNRHRLLTGSMSLQRYLFILKVKSFKMDWKEHFECITATSEAVFKSCSCPAVQTFLQFHSAEIIELKWPEQRSHLFMVGLALVSGNRCFTF